MIQKKEGGRNFYSK